MNNHPLTGLVDPEALRRPLLVFLALFAIAALAGAWVVSQLPGRSADELVILALGALYAVVAAVLLLRKPELVEQVSVMTALVLMAVFLHRIASLMFGPMATSPDYSLFRPIYGFLPMVWISSFVLMASRRAIVMSIGFWMVLMLVFLARVVPEWSLFAQREGFYSVLLMLSIGSPMFIVLLSMLMPMQKQMGDPGLSTLEREVKLAAQIDEARQRLEVALVGSRDALFEWNPKAGGQLWFSPRFYDLIGRGMGDFEPTQDSLSDLVHPDDLAKLDELKSVEREGTANVEIRMLTATRGYRYFSVRLVRIGEGRKGSRFGGSVRDVQARRLQEEKTKQSLIETNDFAKSAAHNLNAPIRRMRMLADRSLRLLRSDGPDLAAVEKNLDRIVDNSMQSQEFIDALLDYAAALVPHDEQEVDLNQLFRELLQDMQSRVKRSRAVVDIGNLPTVLGAPEDLKQLFSELVENALQYSPRTPAIQVEAQDFKDAAVISVHDRGIGVPPEHLYGIFEPLMRLHSREEYEGDGLGLAIARLLCGKYGGQIWAESEPDQGTVIRVRLRTPKVRPAGSSA